MLPEPLNPSAIIDGKDAKSIDKVQRQISFLIPDDRNKRICN